MLKEFAIAASLSGIICLAVTICICILQGLLVVAADACDDKDEDDER